MAQFDLPGAGDGGKDAVHGGLLGKVRPRVYDPTPDPGKDGKGADVTAAKDNAKEKARARGGGAPADRPVVVIAGPTASGKSALALDAAGEFNGTVINADSMQVYAELRVLTARPGPADEARVPHRLFGVLPASETCSAGRWLRLAADEIAAAHKSGRVPMIVGGTGLYLKALLDGMAPVPDIPPEIRQHAQALYARLGGGAFREELAKLDPVSAAALPPGDAQRLTRAFEVVRATGKPLSQWRREQGAGRPVGGRFAVIVLTPPRAALYAAIDARFETMMAAGAVDEVAALRDLGLDAALPAMKAVGVPQLCRYLEGAMDLDAASAKAQQATRNLAKRQFTWFRNQIVPDFGVSEQYSERNKQKIFSFIRNFLLTRSP